MAQRGRDLYRIGDEYLCIIGQGEMINGWLHTDIDKKK